MSPAEKRKLKKALEDFQRYEKVKVEALIAVYGLEGYGLFHYLLDLLRVAVATEHKLPVKGYVIETLKAGGNKCSQDVEQMFTDLLKRFSLFQTDGKQFWHTATSIEQRIALHNSSQRRVAGIKSAAARGLYEQGTNVEQMFTGDGLTNVQSIVTGDIYTSSKVISKKKETIKGKSKILFSDSIYYDKQKFLDAFKGSKYEDADLEYYYEAALNWSESGNNKKVDWIATVRTWILNDRKKNAQVVKKNVKVKIIKDGKFNNHE